MSCFDANKNWAGQFDCEVGSCRRKRLTASEFSRKALDNNKKFGKPLKCKQCVETEAQREREAAAANSSHTKLPGSVNIEASETTAVAVEHEPINVIKHICSSCNQQLTSDNFNRNQLQKGVGKQRCRSCVQTMEQQEANRISIAKAEKITTAKAAVVAAEASGNTVEVLRATAALSALEAEAVTGLKPKVIHKQNTTRSKGTVKSNSISNKK